MKVWRGAALSVFGLTMLGLPLQRAQAAALSPATYVVNSVGDSPDALGGDGVCQTSVIGECTLRAALTEANKDGVTSVVNFNIPGTGVQTITPQTLLPKLVDSSGGTTIDGTTQPGWSANTDPLADNAVLVIQIVGKGPTAFDGLVATTPNNVIRGLSINTFHTNVRFTGGQAKNNVLSGSFLGLDPAGTLQITSTQAGSSCIQLDTQANHNDIGLPTPADRNVIGSCYHQGIATYGVGTNYNRIRNNLVGMTPDGTASRPARANGIDLNTGSSFNVVGGLAPFERNVISGNGQSGIEFSHNAATQYDQAIGNFIGTDVAGDTAPAWGVNGEYGVRLEGAPRCSGGCPVDEGFLTVDSNVIVNGKRGGVMIDKGVHDSVVSNNRIGVTATGVAAPNLNFGLRIEAATRITVGPGNEIANNQVGIQVNPIPTTPPDTVPTPTNFNTITRNSIHDNTSRGIDLAPLGSTNTRGNGNPDANEAMDFPVITGANASTLTGTSCASCVVEVFLADGGPMAYGEGRTYLASGTANSNGIWSVALPSTAAGQLITTTATNPNGSTSEFSKNFRVPTGFGSLASDTFSRTGSDWGAADAGGSWAYPASAAGFSTDGSHGLVAFTAAKSGRVAALPIAAGDVDLQVDTSASVVSNSVGTIAGVIARRQGTNQYLGRLRMSGSTVYAAITATSGGVETVLGSEVPVSGLTATAGQRYRVRLVVTGSSPTTLALTVWDPLQPQPASPTLMVTDSTATLQAPGAFGVRGFVGMNATVPVTLSFDNFTAG